ncbi:NAD(P)-dependent oxidoreductase [Vibrio sp. TRT 17S01]|uniref:precorrin-2 dehydrogenase/sirohydrochlorin ferrochelatase family protein n=1 Tax=Vibrio sp. TRT 17S01 TaxID=3418505 RepID=UPI003CF99A8A
MQYFPLFLDLNNKPVLVVGGGEVACRKVDSLVRAGARVTLISPKVESHLRSLSEHGEIEWMQNFYSKELLNFRYIQVWATTDNPDLNHQVYHDAKALGILVNVVDDQPYCDFITPSMINRGRIQLAISSGGASPILVRNIRQQLESVLPQNLSLLAEFGASKRNDIKQSLPDVDSRRKFWEVFFATSEVEHATNRESLEAVYQAQLAGKQVHSHFVTWLEYGSDVELLSLKALRLMQQAELVFYEKDCPFEFVDLVRRDAERQSFSDEGELSSKLSLAREEQLRVCIFIPASVSRYRLLQGDDLYLQLAK